MRASSEFAVCRDVEVARTHVAVTLKACSSSSRRPCVAERVLYLRLLDDETQLGGAIERHRRHGDPAGFQNGEPAGREHRRVRRAQQHAITGFEPKDLRRARARYDWRGLEAPRTIHSPPSGRQDATLAAMAARRRSVEQLGRRVQAFGIDSCDHRRGAPASLGRREADPLQSGRA